MSHVSTLSEARSKRSRGLALNLAVGPSCFVRCDGCYNLFGRTATRGGLVTMRELEPFVRSAREFGVDQVTVSGGDPLTHPEIFDILAMLRSLGFFIKMDTVGSAFMRDSRIQFYGSGSVSQVDPASIAPLVDMIGLPLDGASTMVQRRFRASGATRKTKASSTEIAQAPSTGAADAWSPTHCISSRRSRSCRC